MSADWDAALAGLRAEYLAEAPGRLARGNEALARLEAGQREAAADLRRVFHGFAGSGSTYGFPRVTELGLQGEALADTWPDRDQAAALARAAQLLAQLGNELLGRAAPELAAPPAAAREPEPAREATDVLLVEDDPAALDALRGALAREGYSVRSARCLGSARAELELRLPGAMVADVVLPDGEVFGLVEWLREQPGGEELPVVLQSVRASLVDRVEAIRCGADAFFPKPFEADAVARRLNLLLLRHAAEPAHVLAVEDDPVQAAFLRGVLEAAGYAFRWCPGPAELEAALAEFHPDLVLMDGLLPGATGYDLARVLRQDERYALLPVVFLTTQVQAGDRLASTRAGATDHLFKPVSPAALLTTVAARLEQARLLRGLMERDGLTGLLTHGALFERAGGVAADARRHGEPAAWILLDVDHFKEVNDRHGHAAGDRVLRALGSILRRRLRRSDVLGRYGGEEFAAVLGGVGLEDAQRLADRLREEFAAMQHEGAGGQPFQVTFSAGVAEYLPPEGPGPWCRRADERLYAAKACGRNRIVAGPVTRPAPPSAGGRRAKAPLLAV